MTNLIPKRIKIGDKWYRTGEKADGSLTFKDDLNYQSSTAQIEYTALRPNPVLNPGLFHVFNVNGIKEGEFWTDPQVSYAGCVSEIDIETVNHNNNHNSNSSNNNSSVSPQRHFPERDENSGCLSYIFTIIGYLIVTLIFSNWGGRIGVILGVILTIYMIATGTVDFLMGIVMGILIILVLGLGGFVIEAIIKLIIKLIRKTKIKNE